MRLAPPKGGALHSLGTAGIDHIIISRVHNILYYIHGNNFRVPTSHSYFARDRYDTMYINILLGIDANCADNCVSFVWGIPAENAL